MSLAQINRAIVVLVIIFVIVFLWRYEQRPLEQQPVSIITCQPTMENCISKAGYGQLQWLVDKSIQYLQPFTNKILFSNIQQNKIRQVSIEFVMQGMKMAVNRSVFTEQSRGVWLAQSVLPICVSGRKDWLAIVRVETQQGIWQTGFEFQLPAE